MTKIAERKNPDSCWNRALWYERMFIILERDAAARAAIERWAEKRIELGLNKPEDAQIRDALFLANGMECNREEVRRQIAETQTVEATRPDPA